MTNELVWQETFGQRLKDEERVNYLEKRWDALSRHRNQCKGPEAPRPQKSAVCEHGCQCGCSTESKVDRNGDTFGVL